MSVVNQIPCDQSGMPKHVMNVWEGKICTKLEVLTFEKAREEIERDKLFLLSPNTKMSPFPLSLIIVL